VRRSKPKVPLDAVHSVFISCSSCLPSKFDLRLLAPDILALRNLWNYRVTAFSGPI
jgi:hypothetical protein